MPDLARLDVNLARRLGFGLSRRLGALPVAEDARGCVLWVRPDIDFDAFIELQAVCGGHIEPVLVPTAVFDRAVQRAFERSGMAADAVQDLDGSIDLEAVSADLVQAADLLDSDDDAPIIRMLNAVLAQAIEEGASDIHVEPFEDRVVVRYRVDGILRDIVEPPRALAARIAARIKVMARLNIAEKRLPQDGRISLRLAGRTVDVRVSTVPTHYGERVVMRVLEKERGPLEFDQIGMPGDVAARFAELIRAPHGIFLVTGPTGSGKTTTLYTALAQVRTADVNIITVEDPVEYDLDGVCQIPVNHKTGMDFAQGLRAILRQDPDVIMIGEIRDLETAEVAVQASLTGHRVFSTLHTNDAVGSVTRLVDMGIDSYLVASSLLGAMAQRLVRRLCMECRIEQRPDSAERRLLGLAPRRRATLFRAGGCEACGYSGYRGRTGLFELLVVDDALRQAVHEGAGERALREAARASGMRTLREDGLAKVLAGETSLEEVIRVTHA
ncbi:MAG: type II secretion system ATPase GspE [Gammaproteobacteria bacterium]|nr:type II secretion system ATPase GspE [Gammaproteobacteria bacterium]MCP5200332.1 type II secretion system ATPase GspE [Gammaproteobacteria bacterium]